MRMYTKTLWLLPVLCVAFLAAGPHDANAKIEVKGDRAFTDSVNNCLTTYRSAPGVVGDVIKELELSGNNHQIMDDPEWSTTPGDYAKSEDGSGTGTVVKVNAAKLEELKKTLPDLKEKDFCTALLHELWHSVDADRGQWSEEKTESIFTDEVEASAFQNLIHAIRGVPARTAYGGVDLTKYIDIQLVKEANVTPKETPAAPETKEKEAAKASLSVSFAHVKPGEYSEVYATVKAAPGEKVVLTLNGPGVSDTAEKTATAGSDGTARITWKIVSYGTYDVAGTAGGSAISGTATVQ